MKCSTYERQIGGITCKLSIPKGSLTRGFRNSDNFYQYKKDTPCRLSFSFNGTTVLIPQYEHDWKSVITQGNPNYLICRQDYEDEAYAAKELSDRVKNHFDSYCNKIEASKKAVCEVEYQGGQVLSVWQYQDPSIVCLYCFESPNKEIAEVLEGQNTQLILGKLEDEIRIRKANDFIVSLEYGAGTELPVLDMSLLGTTCFDIRGYLASILLN